MFSYLDVIYVDIREKERELIDIENCNYRQQRGEKYGLDKACRYKKKVDRGDVDISDVHCNIFTEYLSLIMQKK